MIAAQVKIILDPFCLIGILLVAKLDLWLEFWERFELEGAIFSGTMSKSLDVVVGIGGKYFEWDYEGENIEILLYK